MSNASGAHSFKNSKDRCDFRALPMLEGSVCACDLNVNFCPVTAPYFDPTECECLCPIMQASCKSGFTFNPATCTCDCVPHCTDPRYPSLKRGTGVCDCVCNLSSSLCPKSTPNFNAATCSCSCPFKSSTDCANPALNPKYKT